MWLLYRIAKQLKYKQILKHVGREITVNSLESAVEDILQAVMPTYSQNPYSVVVPSGIENLRGLIGKYGLIDICIELDARDFPLVNFKSGPQLLRDLRIGLNSDTQNFDPNNLMHSEMVTWEIEILKEILGELSRNKTYLLVYLKTQVPQSDDKKQMVAQRMKYMKELPEGFFPRKFVIKDAAVCNAHTFWSTTYHFYL